MEFLIHKCIQSSTFTVIGTSLAKQHVEIPVTGETRFQDRNIKQEFRTDQNTPFSPATSCSENSAKTSYDEEKEKTSSSCPFKKSLFQKSNCRKESFDNDKAARHKKDSCKVEVVSADNSYSTEAFNFGIYYLTP